MTVIKSPFAPSVRPTLKPVEGVRYASGKCALKASGSADLLLVELAEGTSVAGVFTQSLTAAAPVDWCKMQLPNGKARALLVHAGNANAFTGTMGEHVVTESTRAVASALEVKPEEIFTAATGIIGEPFQPGRIIEEIPGLARALDPDGAETASETIMTTDTYPKAVSRTIKTSSGTVTLTGFAKGAGMIAPDMATMLCFVFTDARIDARSLQKCLNIANLKTFSRISIDGDTSTNDTMLLFATGMAQRKVLEGPDLQAFQEGLEEVLKNLSQQVVRDGEGISKFITVRVGGARSDSDALKIAKTIAESPLVKTAMAGCSPNWGRIVMAVGKAGRPVNKKAISVSMGPHLLAVGGNPVLEADIDNLMSYMSLPEIEIGVDVGMGNREAVVYTCDLTAAYVDINASYKT